MKYIPLMLVCLLYGCQKQSEQRNAIKDNASSLHLDYASGFSVVYRDDGTKLVEVLYPFQGATSGYKYLLVPKGKEVPDHGEDVRVISIPLSSIVCTSTTHIPLLDYLGETDKLVGFPSSDYISSSVARKRIDAGHVQ